MEPKTMSEAETIDVVDKLTHAPAAQIETVIRLMSEAEREITEKVIIMALMTSIKDGREKAENSLRLWLSVIEREKERTDGRGPLLSSIMDAGVLQAETAATISTLIAVLPVGVKDWNDRLQKRLATLEAETLTRQIAALQPKAPPPPLRRTAYDTFCDQCERCKHHHPCAFAKNSTLKCPGPKYRGFTFEAA
jgi:hypothetical protein